MMNDPRLRPPMFLLLLLTVTLAATPRRAFAIQPGRWVHTSEADFAGGETDGTIVTNLGDIKLATGTETVGEMPEQASIVYDLQGLADGNVYIAAGPQAKLLRRDGDAVTEVVTLDGEQVFALDQYRGQLLVALSGEQSSRLAVLDHDGELRTLAELPGVRYIWDTLVEDGTIVIATGTDGRVLRIDPQRWVVGPADVGNGIGGEEPGPPTGEADADMADDAGDAADADADADAADGDASNAEWDRLLANPGLTVLLETPQANVLCLARDVQRGRIYAGTDTDGLVYRITFAADGSPEPFVVFDAPEPEIGALLVRDDGTLYAGTADAEQARPGRLGEAVSEPAGRPDAPVPNEVDAPEPGDLPQVPPEAGPIGDEDNGGPVEDGAAPEAAPEAAPDGGDAPAAPSEPGEGDPGDVEEIDEPAPSPMQAGDDDDNGTGESEGDAVDAEADAEPTPEQRDQLRELIRARLEAARESGELQVGRPMARPGARPSAGAPSRATPVAQDRPSQDGNAIYRIDAQGFVQEIFRESVMILKLVEANGRLLVATGNEGQVFSVTPRAEETAILTDLEPEQVSAIMFSPDGDLLLGTSNPAQLVRLDEQFAGRGVYTSAILDAGQISLWGTLNLTADIPAGTSITLETRSGNVQDPEQAPWSSWSAPQAFMPNPDASPLQPRAMKVTSPPARFIQYRLTLTGDGATTPALGQVELAYVTPNMAPRIASIRAAYPDAGRNNGDNAAPSTVMNVEWEASDPNGDQLTYKLEYQPAGAERYILLADDIQENRYEWQTQRVPDGRYLLRLTASDRRDNPGDMARQSSRQSDPVLVDNTPPALVDLEHEVEGDQLVITGQAVDALSSVHRIAYAVDDNEDYEPVLPEDLIFDSTAETWRITIPALSPGPHVVTIRVQDTRGNTDHEALLIEID